MKLKIGLTLILVFIAIQFVPYGKEHTNPAIVAEPQWDTPKTRETFFHTCYDCHSNETKWPWYSKVAPVSWLVQHDVDEGRQHFNVSEWGRKEMNRGSDAAGEVEGGDMPPIVYRIGHPEARLSAEDKKAFIAGLSATFHQEGK